MRMLVLITEFRAIGLGGRREPPTLTLYSVDITI